MVGHMARRATPDLVPVLSKGKHRSPRKGACFMEYVSYLAGERWSDAPTCTHPVLAAVARGVNDHISDAGRARLVDLIPSVVGLSGDQPVVDIGIAIRCASLALPIVPAHRQKTLATGLLTARRALSEMEDGPIDKSVLIARAEQASGTAPRAAQWAEEFTAGFHVSPKAFRSRAVPAIVRVSISGIAEACIPDPDRLLEELLESVIEDCTQWLGDTDLRRVTFEPIDGQLSRDLGSTPG